MAHSEVGHCRWNCQCDQMHRYTAEVRGDRSIPLGPVIELSGFLGGSTPQFIFQPPQLILKNYLGGQAKPPRAAFSNSMHLVLCLHPKISNTCEFQDDPIIRRYDSLVDYLLIYFNRCHTRGCSIFVHLCHIDCYVKYYVCTVNHARSKAQTRPNAIQGGTK